MKVTSDYTFLEVGQGKREEGDKVPLAVCFFNLFSPFVLDNIENTLAVLDSQNISYTVTILDLRGELAGTETLENLLSKIKGCRIFFPGPGSPISALNIFLNEGSSEYFLLLSSDLVLKKFDIESLSSQYLSTEKVIGWLPKIQSQNKVEDTLYGLNWDGKEIYISVRPYEPGRFSALPWKMSFFGKRDNWVNTTTFDNKYHDPFLAALDAGWGVWFHGGKLGAAVGFDCEISANFSELDEVVLFGEFGNRYLKEKIYFIGKNLSMPGVDKILKKWNLRTFFSFHSENKKVHKAILKQREEIILSRSVSDEEIIASLK